MQEISASLGFLSVAKIRYNSQILGQTTTLLVEAVVYRGHAPMGATVIAFYLYQGPLGQTTPSPRLGKSAIYEVDLTPRRRPQLNCRWNGHCPKQSDAQGCTGGLNCGTSPTVSRSHNMARAAHLP